jgi:hypothetical protein
MMKKENNLKQRNQVRMKRKTKEYVKENKYPMNRMTKMSEILRDPSNYLVEKKKAGEEVLVTLETKLHPPASHICASNEPQHPPPTSQHHSTSTIEKTLRETSTLQI